MFNFVEISLIRIEILRKGISLLKQYDAKKILNIALAGHSGSGKTSVAESILYLSKMSERLGKIADGNTVLDFDSEEIKRQTSIMTAVAPIEWKNTKINLIDTPGLFDFAGGVAEGMRAADTALVVVSGKDGVCVGTEKAVEAATKAGLTKVFFVNGLCDESARFYRVFESLKATFGPSVCPVVVPYIVDGQANTYVNLFDYKAYEYGTDGSVKQTALPDMGDRLEGLREAIKEAVAETSEELLDKFIMGEEFTPEEIILGVSQGVKDGTICPVFCGDAHNTFAIDQLLNSLTWLAPSAADKSGEIGVDLDGEPVDVSVNDGGAAAAIVFKTVADPFIGRLSYVKVVSGKVSSDAPLINMRTGAQERITKVLSVSGKSSRMFRTSVRATSAQSRNLHQQKQATHSVRLSERLFLTESTIRHHHIQWLCIRQRRVTRIRLPRALQSLQTKIRQSNSFQTTKPMKC